MLNRFLAGFTLTFAAALYAQPHGTTDTLEIQLTNHPACEAVRTVAVVIEDDASPEGASRSTGAPCRWTFRNPHASFHTKTTLFSLRLGGLRTGCRKAVFNPQTRTAALRLRYAGGMPARRMVIEVVPPTHVDYAREVSGGRDELPCVEWGSVPAPATLTDVQPGMEKIRLQLYPNKTPACGLVVNDLLRKDGRTSLTAEAAIRALPEQANAGDGCRTPTFSGAAIDMFEATLPGQMPESIVITVK